MKEKIENLTNAEIISKLDDIFYGEDVLFLGNDMADTFGGTFACFKYCPSNNQLLISVKDYEDMYSMLLKM